MILINSILKTVVKINFEDVYIKCDYECKFELRFEYKPEDKLKLVLCDWCIGAVDNGHVIIGS